MSDSNQYFLPAEDVNDDKATITEVFFKSGNYVAKGDLIYNFETTKAAVDVKSEHEGFINYYANVGQEVEVGSLVCVISKSKKVIKDKSKNKLVEKDKNILPTKKALLLAKKNQLVIDDLGLKGIVRESDIKNYLNKREVPSSKNTPNAKGKKNIAKLKLDAPKIVIIGAGAQASDLVEIISELKSFEIAGFIDEYYSGGDSFLGLPIIGKHDYITNLKKEGIESVIITFVWVKDLQKRLDVTKFCLEEGLKFPSIIHPKSVIHPSAEIYPGTIVLANTLIGSHVELGFGAIVNNNAVVSHGTKVGNFTHICPRATVASNVKIGNSCVIGMNSSIFYGLKIGDNNIIKNNSSVLKNYI